MAQWIWDKTIAHKQANKLDPIPIPMGDKVTTPFFLDSKDPSKGRPLHTRLAAMRFLIVLFLPASTLGWWWTLRFFSYVEPKEENQHNQTCLFIHDLCNN